ncbi:60S ribosomal protein L27, mitochondrial [Gnomoniopsis smithogilvyi]|uniref:60S ribosomal protein L27, mitochondrial n=1 Tax=Gnomoniopsis smithogilvyi TaxID=1191159 RepID=A0A9W8YV98_9PEZI|nr:60S ribosomal protein L27, mitochondrial [Gnomoniopsis smithogilvyi]
MFKPTQALCKRFRKLRITTKDINKGFYKGTRTGRMGNHDKNGGYLIDYSLVRTYVVPKNLNEFKLTPFVTNNKRKQTGLDTYKDYGVDGPRNPKLFLDKWKELNGVD